MGRNAKYIEETISFSKKIPKSQKDNVEKLVDDYLKPFEVGYIKPEPTTFDKMVESQRVFYNSDNLLSAKIHEAFGNSNAKEVNAEYSLLYPEHTNRNLKDVIENTKFKDISVTFKKRKLDCGCELENNIFRRAKGCKLSKEQHKF
jgi:hypothetical protein